MQEGNDPIARMALQLARLPGIGAKSAQRLAYHIAAMPLDQVKAVFELRAACLSGYTPDLIGCHVCGSQMPDRFDLSSGLLECQNCRDASSGGIRLPVSPGILEAMRFICFCDPKKLFSFRLNPAELHRLSQVTEGFLTTQLERSFSALDYYKSLCLNLEETEST